MQDLISRQAALYAIYGICNEPVAWLIRAAREIEKLPSAQPERTGKWIEYDNSHCECPFCHEEWSYFDNEVEYFNYCPNCGARMES